MSDDFQTVNKRKRNRKQKIEYKMYSDASSWKNPKFVCKVSGINEGLGFASRLNLQKWWHLHDEDTDNVIDFYGETEISRGKHPYPINYNDCLGLDEETNNLLRVFR